MIYPERWLFCSYAFYVQEKKNACPLLSFPFPLCLSLLLVSLLWMSGLSVSQSDMIRVSDITPGSRQRAGERVTCSHIQKLRAKRSPTFFLWGSLITGQFIHHPGFLSFIQLVCFPTPMEMPKVWIYSVRSKAVASITDKTEFVIQQILRLWSVTIGALWEDSTSPFRVSIRCTLSL